MILGSEAEADRWARVAWSRIAEPQDAAVRDWIAAKGASAALRDVVEGRVARDGRYAARLAELDLPGAVRALDRHGYTVVVPGDAGWPDGVDLLRTPPLCLYVRGDADLASLFERSVAVVGSRDCTDYGVQVTAALASGLANRNVCVVSGAAYGIDAAAHRSVLAAEGRTVAFLACGVDRVYPEAHRGMLAEIARTGAVVSEIPLGGAPFRLRFLARNRLIAAVTLGTVVVEASARSGSLNTARHARDLVKPVAAVPGPVTRMQSAGCHDLIRTKGASLVTDAAEVMDLMGRIGDDLAEVRRGPESTTDGLSPTVLAVWAAVPVRRGVEVEVLARATALPSAAVAGALATLELDGLVRRSPAGWSKAR